MHTPKDVRLEPDAVSITWDDGTECRLPHRYLRSECRCAACLEEMTGRRIVTYDSVPEDVQALDWMPVGRYALRFLWSDLHDTGIYPFQLLRELCHAAQGTG